MPDREPFAGAWPAYRLAAIAGDVIEWCREVRDD